VGLIGFPNVGKSTLLSVISAAKPKIADYHFTTLVPNMGIVSVGGASFAVADIPGLIEGANEGAGLGIDFLRHIDRCRLLIHVVDASQSEGRDVVEDYEQINSELFLYSEELSKRPQIVAANKCDLITDDSSGLDRLKSHLKDYNIPLFEISAATRSGVDELMKKAAEMLSHLPPVKIFEPEYIEQTGKEEDTVITITRRDDGAFVIEGKRLMRAIALVDPDDYESLGYMQRVLRQNGVFDMLEEKGIKEGDLVSINNFEFEYVK
jgi:GTP-binding protein